MRPASELPLHGKRILVAEDHALIALDLQATLEGDGAAVVGPFRNLTTALRAASSDAALDAALLDVDLGDEDVFPLADRLAERGIPFVFHTGHSGIDRLHTRYNGAPVISKPARPGEIRQSLMSVIAGQETRS